MARTVLAPPHSALRRTISLSTRTWTCSVRVLGSFFFSYLVISPARRGLVLRRLFVIWMEPQWASVHLALSSLLIVPPNYCLLSLHPFSSKNAATEVMLQPSHPSSHPFFHLELA